MANKKVQKEILKNIIHFSEQASFIIAQIPTQEFKQSFAVDYIETITENLKTLKKIL